MTWLMCMGYSGPLVEPFVLDTPGENIYLLGPHHSIPLSSLPSVHLLSHLLSKVSETKTSDIPNSNSFPHQYVPHRVSLVLTYTPATPVIVSGSPSRSSVISSCLMNIHSNLAALARIFCF